jgi:hypothetical protein
LGPGDQLDQSKLTRRASLHGPEPAAGSFQRSGQVDSTGEPAFDRFGRESLDLMRLASSPWPRERAKTKVGQRDCKRRDE